MAGMKIIQLDNYFFLFSHNVSIEYSYPKLNPILVQLFHMVNRIISYQLIYLEYHSSILDNYPLTNYT